MAIHSHSGRVACLLAVALAAVRPTAPQSMDEYRVKAGFVSAFASFVEWPPEAFRSPRDPVRICVLGRNPFGASLDEFVQGKVVEEHPVVVRDILDVNQSEGCHIVFVASSEHLRLRFILESLRDRTLLSIGDTGDFIAEGGIAGLRLDNGKVRIEINADAAKDHRLRISSRLLQLAKNVRR